MKLVGVVADALDWRVIIQAEALGHWSTRADLSPVPSRVANSLPVPVQEPESAFSNSVLHTAAREVVKYFISLRAPRLACGSVCARMCLAKAHPDSRQHQLIWDLSEPKAAFDR